MSSSNVRPYGFVQLSDPRRSAPASSEASLAALSADVEAEMEAARARGEVQGYHEGLQRALAEQRGHLERLAQLVEDARTDSAELIRQLELQVIALALDVAQKVIERELQSDPSVVLDVVRSTLTEVQDAASVHVRVHPQDHALIEAQWHAIGRNAMGEPIVLVADERVEPGGCLIETALGHIDSQLSTRFGQVADLFDAVREGETS
jgi:flagellar assembly protein FliH